MLMNRPLLSSFHKSNLGHAIVMPQMSPPEDTSATANGEEVTFEFTVPDGVIPGDKLQATTPAGVKVKLLVPMGAEPGTILTFALPASVSRGDRESKAAATIQATLRGKHARMSIVREPEVIEAALKVQKHYRGHTTRNEQQEYSRLQWMTYYMQPEVAEWDEAVALVRIASQPAMLVSMCIFEHDPSWRILDRQAVTDDEEARIRAVQMGVTYEEEKRVKWLDYHISHSNFDKAAELVITPLEAALVLKGRATAAQPCAWCGPSVADAERERHERFVQAIKACTPLQPSSAHGGQG
jgi:hypothetical protein